MLFLQHLPVSALRRVMACAENYAAAYKAQQHTPDDILADDKVEAREDLFLEIEKLDRDARDELVAMMWLGRGDFGGSPPACLEHARGGDDDEEQIAYIVAKGVVLGEYLRTALDYIEGRRRTREEIVDALVDLGLASCPEQADDGVEDEFKFETAAAIVGEDAAEQIWSTQNADKDEPLYLSFP